MALYIFIFITICYCFLSAIAYIPSVKNSSYYYALGIAISTVVNFLWLYLTKHTQDLKLINKYAYIWDGIIVLTAAIIPIVFFNIVPKGSHLLGIVLVVLGIILLKL